MWLLQPVLSPCRRCPVINLARVAKTPTSALATKCAAAQRDENPQNQQVLQIPREGCGARRNKVEVHVQEGVIFLTIFQWYQCQWYHDIPLNSHDQIPWYYKTHTFCFFPLFSIIFHVANWRWLAIRSHTKMPAILGVPTPTCACPRANWTSFARARLTGRHTGQAIGIGQTYQQGFSKQTTHVAHFGDQNHHYFWGTSQASFGMYEI